MILKTESGEVLSTKIKGLNPYNLTEGGVIIKRLLDGSINVQKVGSTPKSISFETLIGIAEVGIIASAYINGAKLLIQDLERTIEFIMTETPVFERFNGRYRDGRVIAKLKGVEQ